MNIGDRGKTNLIVNISPPKCGTTSLYNCIVNSSVVSRPAIKESRFFTEDNLDAFAGLPNGLEQHGNYKHGIEWHHELFDAECKYRIDFTTYYSITQDTPTLVKRHYPNAKAILVVRHPVDRFVSHYYQYVKMGIDMPDFEELIHEESELSRFMFEFSDYRSIYKRYKDALGANNILVLPFNALVERPSFVTSQVAQFLNIPNFEYRPSESEKYGAGVPRVKALQKIFFSQLVRNIGARVSPSLKIKLLAARRRLFKLNTRQQSYPVIDQRARQFLSDKFSDGVNYYKQVTGNAIPKGL